MVFLNVQIINVQDTELIARLNSSDEHAFEDIFREHYAKLCTYANSLIKDPDESEEIVQSIFLGLWEGRQELSIHTSLSAYLYRTVHNRCLNKIKHYKVREAHGAEVRYLNDGAHEATAEVVLGDELRQRIAIAVEELPSQCQAVFKLSRNEGLSYAEIAERLGISTKAVDKQIVRALRLLRVSLKDYLPAILLFLLFKN